MLRRTVAALVAGGATCGMGTLPALADDAANPGHVVPGVVVAGVPVGGQTYAEAVTTLRRAMAARAAIPVEVRYGRRAWKLRPDRFGYVAAVYAAAAEAIALTAPARLPIVERVSRGAIRAYVGRLAGRVSVPARDARLAFFGGAPHVRSARGGFALDTAEAADRLAEALAHPSTRPVRLPRLVVRPRVTRASLGPVIVINRSGKSLTLYRDGDRLWQRYGVATGMSAYPTPGGLFRIVVMQRSPWWYPPNSAWAAGKKPVPPGPGNPLGTRWMGLSAPGIGIHGTPDAASIGYSASHGCIRMHIPDAEQVFGRVRVGTPVLIV
jgi:hypothetical protein